MPRNFVLGLNAKAYYTSDGNLPTNEGLGTRRLFSTDAEDGEVLKLVCIVQDVTTNISPRTSEGTTRCSGGWVEQVATIKEGSIDTTILWRPDDPVFNHILNAALNGTTIPLGFVDGDKDVSLLPTSGDVITGLYADFIVGDFVRNEPLEDALTADVTFSVAPSENVSFPPEWVNYPKP